MKKRWIWVLLYVVYGVLLAALIVLQWTTMREDVLRLFANILALLLACPVMLLLFAGRADSEKTISRKHADTKHADTEKQIESEEQSGIEEQRESEEQIDEELQDSRAEPRIRTMEDFCERVEQWNFSPREQEVGWLIYKGYTNRQIAQELYIAETTVKKHAGHIYEKAGVSGRKEFSAL